MKRERGSDLEKERERRRERREERRGEGRRGGKRREGRGGGRRGEEERAGETEEERDLEPTGAGEFARRTGIWGEIGIRILEQSCSVMCDMTPS